MDSEEKKNPLGKALGAMGASLSDTQMGSTAPADSKDSGDDKKEAAAAAIKDDEDKKEKKKKLLLNPALKGAGRFFGGMGSSLRKSTGDDE